jgi:hypothetical protein
MYVQGTRIWDQIEIETDEGPGTSLWERRWGTLERRWGRLARVTRLVLALRMRATYSRRFWPGPTYGWSKRGATGRAVYCIRIHVAGVCPDPPAADPRTELWAGAFAAPASLSVSGLGGKMGVGGSHQKVRGRSHSFFWKFIARPTVRCAHAREGEEEDGG